GADIRGDVDLVDDQQGRLGDAGAALARDLVALADIDDVDVAVDQFGAEGGGQIVAAALDEDDVEVGKLRGHLLRRVQVHRHVLADRSVRATARFHAGDARRVDRAAANDELGVFLRVDVVGDG